MKSGQIVLLLILLSSAAVKGQQVGAFTSFQHNEITPGLYLRLAAERVAYQWDMSIPILLHDPYNENRPNASFWSGYMAAIGLMEYFVGPQIESDSPGGLVAEVIFLALPVISNGQLHLNLIPKSAVDSTGSQVSAFIGWDTALFELRENQWFRIAPKVGLACYRLLGSPDGDRKRFSLGLQMGVKMNVDAPAKGKSPVVAFMTAEVGIY